MLSLRLCYVFCKCSLCTAFVSPCCYPHTRQRQHVSSGGTCPLIPLVLVCSRSSLILLQVMMMMQAAFSSMTAKAHTPSLARIVRELSLMISPLIMFVRLSLSFMHSNCPFFEGNPREAHQIVHNNTHTCETSVLFRLPIFPYQETQEDNGNKPKGGDRIRRTQKHKRTLTRKR